MISFLLCANRDSTTCCSFFTGGVGLALGKNKYQARGARSALGPASGRGVGRKKDSHKADARRKRSARSSWNLVGRARLTQPENPESLQWRGGQLDYNVGLLRMKGARWTVPICCGSETFEGRRSLTSAGKQDSKLHSLFAGPNFGTLASSMRLLGEPQGLSPFFFPQPPWLSERRKRRVCPDIRQPSQLKRKARASGHPN